MQGSFYYRSKNWNYIGDRKNVEDLLVLKVLKIGSVSNCLVNWNLWVKNVSLSKLTKEININFTYLPSYFEIAKVGNTENSKIGITSSIITSNPYPFYHLYRLLIEMLLWKCTQLWRVVNSRAYFYYVSTIFADRFSSAALQHNQEVFICKNGILHISAKIITPKGLKSSFDI